MGAAGRAQMRWSAVNVTASRPTTWGNAVMRPCVQGCARFGPPDQVVAGQRLTRLQEVVAPRSCVAGLGSVPSACGGHQPAGSPPAGGLVPHQPAFARSTPEAKALGSSSAA